MNISPESWKRIDPLLDEALDLDAAARPAWLADLQAREPILAPVVATLLATHERAERLSELETVPQLAAAPPASSPWREGETVGPFRLVRPLGRGGMGEVWLAAQADGRVERQVALKLPDLLGAGSLRAERFARERDILAKLEHPHIARLYDAGVSAEGQPWLAMEYVQGVPLDAWLRERDPPLEARIALVRQVLDAVGHAHRRLVVHRDIKPANILVDAEGQAKLLDFGIAKLVDGEGEPGARDDLTRVGARILTPRYAAPEQAEGSDLTTATDVYSLGVVLHEALTGLSSYRAVREGRALSAAALMAESIARPSTIVPAPLAKRLAGDLDAILLKALRADPAERYATVGEFDDDLRRHLEHRPVKARAGTWRYLAGRFARRHRLPIAMAAAAVLALAAGLVTAEIERREAEAQRARAERHFASVRQLANAVLFDVHADIEKLPGSLAVRQKLVKTSLDYLDALAKEPGRDPQLEREIAAAYRRIAQVEGDPLGSNLGQLEAARAHLGKAVSMLEALDKPPSTDVALLRELRTAKSLEARMRLDAGPAAVMATREANVRVAERVVALPGATADDRRELGTALAELAVDQALVGGDLPKAFATMAKSLAALEALAKERPADRAARQDLANALDRESLLLEQKPGPATLRRSIEAQSRSVELTEALYREDPLDQRAEQSLVKRRVNLARTQRYAGDLPAAQATVERALEVSESAFAKEPGNAANAVTHLVALSTAASLDALQGRPERALARYEAVEKVHAGLPEATRQTLRVRAQYADARGRQGLALMTLAEQAKDPAPTRLARAKQARVLFVEARAFRQELVDRNVDAALSAKAVEQITATIAECDALIARLAKG